MSATRGSNYVVVIHAVDDGYRAELWFRPYIGWMVACTRLVARVGTAKRDARKWLFVPEGARWDW
jgi:hypothetical protein